MNKKLYLLPLAGLLLAGCSADDLAGIERQLPISLTAEVEDVDVSTRAGTSVLTSFATNDAFYAYFPSNVRVGSTTSASNTTFTFSGSTWSPATQPYFNAGASSATVHAYYPYVSGKQVTNTTSSFSVETDQSTDANYKKSDLMYATATINKGATGSLTFAHRMAKILVTANKGTGISKITAVKIVGGNRTINIATPQSCTLGSSLSNANSSTNITLYSNSSNTSNVSCAGLIPPQTINGNFLQIVTDQGTATYSLSSKQFESAKSYQLTITVNQAAIGTTVAITNWTGTNNVTVNPTVEVEMINPMMNPLWWMAQYNMAQGGTSFVSSHSTADQYCFNWTDACAVTVANYGLPTRAEQTSIIPCDEESSNGTNIFDLSQTLASPKEFYEVACTVGDCSVSANVPSVIGKNASGDYYAVRFIGTPYASAWHYKWVTSPCNGLLIESYLVYCTTVADAKTILAGLVSSTIFTGAANASDANQTPESTTETKSAFCQRFLPACGYRNNSGSGGSGAADYFQGSGGSYWSATAKDDTYGWNWSFGSSGLHERSDNKKYGYSVRLFRGWDWGYPTVSSATSADVGKVICSNGHIHKTVSSVRCGGVASGIIAYVGSAGTADKSSGSSSYKGLALALYDCGGSLTSNGTAYQWYTTDGGVCVCESSSVSTAIGSSGDWGKGIDNTNRLATPTCKSGHTHAAARNAKNFSVARPTGASQWFLPTMYQWNLMVKAMCGKSTNLTTSENDDYKADKFNEKITAAGGRGVSGTYWSSVEYDVLTAWYLYFYSGYADDGLKSNGRLVRAVFAF